MAGATIHGIEPFAVLRGLVLALIGILQLLRRSGRVVKINVLGLKKHEWEKDGNGQSGDR